MVRKDFSPGRRDVLRTSAALASGAAFGFPAILRAQSEVIRIGHLTSLTLIQPSQQENPCPIAG